MCVASLRLTMTSHVCLICGVSIIVYCLMVCTTRTSVHVYVDVFCGCICYDSLSVCVKLCMFQCDVLVLC